MGSASLVNQIAYVLDILFWDKEDIETYKALHQVLSVKRALRPGGDPTRALPAILSYRTRATYFQTAIAFFRRAKALTGKRLLADLMDPATILHTLDIYYRDHSSSTLRKVLATIGKLHQGCVQAGWTAAPSPITDSLRDHVRSYHDDASVRQARFGYIPKDAERILVFLIEKNSAFALAAEIVLRCGLRLSEVAGLKGEEVDLKNMVLHITGKGGKLRTVMLPVELAGQLNPSKQYLFSPSPSWRRAFYRAVRQAARELGIRISGVHRLRSNYAQNLYEELRKSGKGDREARQEVSHQLGHNRPEVTNSYIPHS